MGCNWTVAHASKHDLTKICHLLEGHSKFEKMISLSGKHGRFISVPSKIPWNSRTKIFKKYQCTEEWNEREGHSELEMAVRFRRYYVGGGVNDQMMTQPRKPA